MLETLAPVLLQAGVLTLAILSAVYFCLKSSYSYWTKLGIPIYNPVVPFGNFGAVLMKKSNLQSEITALDKAFEDHKLGGLYTFSKNFLLVRDPDLIKDILMKDFNYIQESGIVVSENGDPLDRHLFLLSGAKWRNLRIRPTPTFTSGNMKMIFATLVECGRELSAVLQESARQGQKLEVKDSLARFTTDIIASCAFGIQCNCLRYPEAEFHNWGKRIFEATFRFRLLSSAATLMPSLIKRFGLSFILSDASNYFKKMVSETVEYREKNNIKRNDFMHLLIQLKNITLTPNDHEASKSADTELDAVDSKELGMYAVMQNVTSKFMMTHGDKK
jgi:cytochrome P450 family 6